MAGPNTFGEPWRHLSSKSPRAWTIEKVSIHAVLFLALVTTAIVWLNWAVGKQFPSFSRFAFEVQGGYGFVVGAMWAGVIGVGLYPLMGTRVWCRFGCPPVSAAGCAPTSAREAC